MQDLIDRLPSRARFALALVALAATAGCLRGPTCTEGACREGAVCDLDGTCRDGSELGACGSSGAACMACGTGQLCERGSCIIDGASRWKIRVLDALVPTTKTSGEAWDGFGGAPDPAVIVRSGTRMFHVTLSRRWAAF